MNYITQFKEYLLSQSTPVSKVTVKNYVSDINRFINWYEKRFNISFNPNVIDENLINTFKLASLSQYSAASVERNISSLRKFFSYLQKQQFISQSPFEAKNLIQRENNVDPWRLHEYKNFLYSEKVSNLTIKNYIIDLKQFKEWSEASILDTENANSKAKLALNKVNSSFINEYKNWLLSSQGLSPISINRKLSSIRRFVTWATQLQIITPEMQALNNLRLGNNSELIIPNQNFVEKNEKNTNEYSSFAPIRVIQKTNTGISLLLDALIITPLILLNKEINHATWILKGKPLFDSVNKNYTSSNNLLKENLDVRNFSKVTNPSPLTFSSNNSYFKNLYLTARHSRPNWYKRYHSYPFTSYFHLALLSLAIIFFSYVLFQNLGINSKNPNVLGTITQSTPKILTYQGRITDSNGNPINYETKLRMSIYNNEKASGSALLWQEVIEAMPNRDGDINAILGRTNPIPESLFQNNAELFLGIAVEDTRELNPRQPIATVAYAQNSQSLQGLEPITKTDETRNVILALNSSGNLTIGGNANPVFQATGGTFTISGRTLLLTTTASSSGNIVLNPDGQGIIDIQKSIQNTSNDNLTLQGAVLFDDMLLINSTSSAQAALNINQNSSGNLISASSGFINKFTIDNGGNIFTYGKFNGLEVISGSVTTGLWKASLISPIYGGTGLNTSTSNGIPIINQGVWSVNNSLGPSLGGTGITSYNAGDMIYANSSNTLTKLSIGTTNQCLTSNGTSPVWSNCPSSTNQFFNQSLGSLFTNNTTLDFLIGGDSTSSAKFAIINLSTNLPTATISGNLIVMPNNGNGGNVGFGTSMPDSKLQVSGGGLCVGSDTDCNIDNNIEGVIYASSTSTSVYDVAENYPTNDYSLKAGEVVTMNPEKGVFVKRATKPYDPLAIGAISQEPGLLLGGFNGNQYKDSKQVPVALSGRILIQASDENGKIYQGDFVTSSTTPGKVMKATKPGPVIGQALENLDPEKNEVMVFIKATYFSNEEYITDATELNIIPSKENGFNLTNKNELVVKIGAYSDLFVARLKAGYLELGRLTVETANIAYANIQNLSVNSLAIATENITIAGQDIRDYIYSIVDDRITQKKLAITSPILEADMIKPVSGSNISLKLPTNDTSSKVEILNASNSAVASIDAQGNVYTEGNLSARSASFSGNLTSNNLETNNASISGTLRADKIIADQIDLSEEAIAKLQGITLSSTSANYITNNYYYNSTNSAIPNDSNLANLNSNSDIASFTADSGIFTNNLISWGQSSFYDVSIASRLFIGGQLSIADRSINVLGGNLELQPLRQGGVSIAGGLVEFDSEGNLKVGGNAYFAKDVNINGKLLTGIISPLPGKDLIFDFKSDELKNSKIEFKTGSGSAVLTFNYKGDINSSGSGTFNKINLSLIRKALAVSDTEVIATGSAGTTEIKPYQNEVTIKNSVVTKDSLIYITPTTDIGNQSVYLLRQSPQNPNTDDVVGSFTVGISKILSKSVSFNWIIIN